MTVTKAPLNRALVDTALPWLRGSFGVLFIAFSAASTVTIGAADLMVLFAKTRAATIGGGADAYWYSSVAALIFFLGEVATAERYKQAYWLFLIPDTFYTARGMFQGFAEALGVLASSFFPSTEPVMFLGSISATPAQAIGAALAVPVCAVIGYYVAKWGEVLVFGKRRTIRGAVISKE